MSKKTFQDEYPNGVELSEDIVNLMELKRKEKQAITFDETTLEDKPSDFHPNDIKLHSWVTRNIMLKGCGIMSAAMDTVTEREMALTMAKMGGMGIIHRNLEPEEQAAHVKWVRLKIHYGGMIDKPICFGPEEFYSTVQQAIKTKGFTFTSFPIIDENGKLLGLLTRDEVGFVEESNPKLKDIMKPRNAVVTAPEGTTSEQAYQIMKDKRVKKLIIVDKEDHLKGIYVWNDVKSDQRKRELFSLDDEGHFLVGAAIGLGKEDLSRAEVLVQAGCKVLVLDSSHGACLPARNQIEALREKFGNKVEIIVGNIASYASATYLLEGKAKPDALKIGIGPGSICTTRQVTGHGIPQLTAVYECRRVVRDYGKKHGYYVPIVADGGIRSSGDIVKALCAGATSVMMGNALVGTIESPGQLIFKNGKRYKMIRGMGSRSAMEERSGSRSRYHRQDAKAMTSESLTMLRNKRLCQKEWRPSWSTRVLWKLSSMNCWEEFNRDWHILELLTFLRSKREQLCGYNPLLVLLKENHTILFKLICVFLRPH